MEAIDPKVRPTLVPAGSRPVIVNDRDKTYQDLPSIVTPNGYVITRWQPTEHERELIAKGEDIYVTLLSAGQINPLFVTVGPVDWTVRY